MFILFLFIFKNVNFVCNKYLVFSKLHLEKISIGLLHVFYFLDIKLERESEAKHLNNLKHQENIAKEIQFALRGKQGGLRRPLPPK